MDSRKIADTLEQRHPSPSLHLDAEVLREVEAIATNLLIASCPLILPLVPRHILNDESVEYFQQDRAKRFGTSLDQLEKEKGGEAAWKQMQAPLQEVAKLLKKADGGPFFLGKTGLRARLCSLMKGYTM